MSQSAPLRVLVVDDSAKGREELALMLEESGEARVVARAQDGDEALRAVFEHAPDLVTLDLEMPRMDGFTFLRILMNRRPTPVLVITAHLLRDTEWKVLELGALDVLAKPTGVDPLVRRVFADDLKKRLERLRQLRVVGTLERGSRPLPMEKRPEPVQHTGELRVVAIGASTGGPPALQQLIGSLDADLGAAVIIVQHMPPRFTRTFAERLDRASALDVREAAHGDLLRPGLVLVCPGDASLELERAGDRFKVRVVAPSTKDRYTPSIDRLFKSAAAVVGVDLLAVVLTGMGVDGGEGVRAVRAAGGTTAAESHETAVIFGMPEEAIGTGCIDRIAPLPRMVDLIARFARRAAV